jgi:hypothetical protein
VPDIYADSNRPFGGVEQQTRRTLFHSFERRNRGQAIDTNEEPSLLKSASGRLSFVSCRIIYADSNRPFGGIEQQAGRTLFTALNAAIDARRSIFTKNQVH